MIHFKTIYLSCAFAGTLVAPSTLAQGITWEQQNQCIADRSELDSIDGRLNHIEKMVKDVQETLNIVDGDPVQYGRWAKTHNDLVGQYNQLLETYQAKIGHYNEYCANKSYNPRGGRARRGGGNDGIP